VEYGKQKDKTKVFLKRRSRPGAVVHIYNPSYLGGEGRRIVVRGWSQTLCQTNKKNLGAVAHAYHPSY
jgi:hypothetical protein